MFTDLAVVFFIVIFTVFAINRLGSKKGESCIPSEILVLVIVLGFYLFAFWLCFFDFTFFSDRYLKEDGIVENITVVLYLNLIFKLIFKLRESKYYSLPIFFSLFVIGEEISWGQRILGYQTPTILSEYNLQREVTLHNTHVGAAVMTICAILVLSYFIISPFSKTFQLLIERVGVRAPRLYIPIILITSYLLSFILYLFSESAEVQELTEYIFAVVFSCYTLTINQYVTIVNKINYEV